MTETAPPRLSIQVVTWNSADVIDGCLESVWRQTDQELEVIVVDNASHDGSADRAQAWIDRGVRGRVVRERVNHGFCGGHNRALALSRGEAILLLNPDARLAPHFVATALRAMATAPADVGLFAPCILLPDGRVDSTGLELDSLRRGWDRGSGAPSPAQFESAREVFGCTGAVALLRREMLDEIAVDGRVFDERLFAYCDDMDISWRAHLAGWRCLYVPELMAEHRRAGRNSLRRQAAAAPRAFEQTLMVRNRLLVLAKCERLVPLLLAMPRLLAFELARIVFLALRAPTVLRAYPQALGMLPAVLRERRIIRSASRASR